MWSLSAPESYVVLHGVDRARNNVGEVLKLAFLELATRRAIRIVDVSAKELFGRVTARKAILLGPPVTGGRAAVEEVHSAISAVRETTFADGTSAIDLRDAVAAIGKRFSSVSLYLYRIVFPALSAEGVLTLKKSLLWGDKWRMTERGEGQRGVLRELLDRGTQRAAAWKDAPAADAAAYLAALGSAALLLPNAGTLLPELARRIQDLAPDVDDGWWDRHRRADLDGASFDTSSIGPDLDLSPSLDLDGLASLGTSFDDISSSDLSEPDRDD